MPSIPVTYAEALALVQDLATQNQIDERDVAFGDSGLGDQRAWQDTALETVQAYIDGGGPANMPEAPGTVAPVAIADVAADRASDPSELPSAVRIVLDMARDNVLQDDGEDMAGEVARQEAAVALVSDLVARHPDAIVAPSAPRAG